MASGYIDARNSDAGDIIEASVCIVGSGAAGITLARKLADTVDDLVLIESGGFSLEGETQNLFSGRNLSLPYFNLAACRLRYWGGTTNHWSGFCRANDAIDYEGRPELNLPKWPVGHDEVEPYIAEAAESLGISPKFFEPQAIFQNKGLETEDLVDRKSQILQTKVFQIAQDIRLGPKYREQLGSAPKLRIYHHLNLTHIQLAPDGGRVEHLDCATLNGRKVRVKAKIFAICCHGIENARLLLVSNDVMNVGVGNAYDHVGRYFMDHTTIPASKFIPSPSFPVAYDRMFADNYNLNANVGFTDDYIREAKLLQYYCRFNPIYMDEKTKESLAYLRDEAMQPGSTALLKDVMTVLGEVGGVARFGFSRLNLTHFQPDYYELEHRLEQAPNPDSRVVISDRRDALGNLIADLDWRIVDEDVRSFKLGQEKIVAEFSALGYGRVEKEEITRDLVESRIAGHYHQIGTTRMSDRPEDGVVDRNLKVHGVDNLYIGGSSTFPTAGYSGPTMMIVGFSIRLAAHIKQQLSA
ncbi:GMC oxidoreductase [uncultured Tistrella sp.]|uniref:GMC oxidoreductase n=1 Tax=Tistrella mobilis TaxID=171437 RepID=UPI000C09D7D8|nr:GMC family oxidoreductase [uncultured Tistrella sp.]MAM72345.1 hypothetical protein [Tistrella sp.]